MTVLIVVVMCACFLSVLSSSFEIPNKKSAYLAENTMDVQIELYSLLSSQSSKLLVEVTIFNIDSMRLTQPCGDRLCCDLLHHGRSNIAQTSNQIEHNIRMSELLSSDGVFWARVQVQVQ
jgi:hypothetical protein